MVAWRASDSASTFPSSHWQKTDMDSWNITFSANIPLFPDSYNCYCTFAWWPAGGALTNDMNANVTSFIDAWAIKCRNVMKHFKVKCVTLPGLQPVRTDHKELAEGDVREDVVRLVLATGDARLLPEVWELLEQRPAGSQVQHVLPGQRIVQEWVVHVREEPGATDTANLRSKCQLDERDIYCPADGSTDGSALRPKIRSAYI